MQVSQRSVVDPYLPNLKFEPKIKNEFENRKEQSLPQFGDSFASTAFARQDDKNKKEKMAETAFVASVFLAKAARTLFSTKAEKPVEPSLYQKISNALSRSLSDAAKLKNTEEQALSLFEKYNDDRQGLIDALEEMGVIVLDGSKLPWIQESLVNKQSAGSLHIPHKEPAVSREVLSEQLKRNKISGMRAFSQNAGHGILALRKLDDAGLMKETLFHEAFHLLQALNGLPFDFGGEAGAVEGTILRGRFLKSFDFENLAEPEPEDLSRKSLPILTSDGAKSNRIVASREQENYRFLERHQAVLNLDKKLFEDYPMWLNFYDKLAEHGAVVQKT